MFDKRALRRLRRERDLRQVDVGDVLGVSAMHISRFENPKHPDTPNKEQIKTLAKFFGVNEQEFYTTEETARIRTKLPTPTAGEMYNVPLYFDLSACCGDGFDVRDVYGCEPDAFIPVPRARIGEIDPERPPYGIYADGDSMEDYGIHHRDIVVVNPALPVVSRFPSHVRYRRRDMVKFVEHMENRPVVLRSANEEEYPPITVEEQFDEMDGLYVFGRVVCFCHYGFTRR